MPSKVRRYTGSAWQENYLYRWTGSAWQQCDLYRWDGSVWVQIDGDRIVYKDGSFPWASVPSFTLARAGNANTSGYEAQSNRIYLWSNASNAGGQAWLYTPAIDIGPWKQLEVTQTYSLTHWAANLEFGITDATSHGWNQTWLAKNSLAPSVGTSLSGTETRTLDISAVTGSHRIMLGLRSETNSGVTSTSTTLLTQMILR